MVFITHKVLNLVHSDTIACVLYELLVCRSLGFGIVFRDFPSRLRFHKFQYCSIFKVLLALLSDSSIIISKVVLFVKHFFRYFFELSERLFKSFPPARYPVPRCVFAGTSLLFGFWRAAVLRDSLFIIPHFQPLSTPFFDFFHNFFDLFLGRVHMGALTWFLYSIKFNPLSIPYSSPMFPYTLMQSRNTLKHSLSLSNHINPAFLWLFLAVFPVFYSFYFPSRSPPILFPTKFVTFMRI